MKALAKTLSKNYSQGVFRGSAVGDQRSQNEATTLDLGSQSFSRSGGTEVEAEASLEKMS